jgi:hypothetical protein
MTAEQLAARNAAISEGQRRAWTDPIKRARRTAAIRAAWDDPLARALMSHKIAKVRKPTP